MVLHRFIVVILSFAIFYNYHIYLHICNDEKYGKLVDPEEFTIKENILEVNDNFDDALYMLLDINSARIIIEYEYDEVNTNFTFGQFSASAKIN